MSDTRHWIEITARCGVMGVDGSKIIDSHRENDMSAEAMYDFEDAGLDGLKARLAAQRAKLKK